MGSGRRGPSGPSKEEIERQAREQERKVKFEAAKGRYLGSVAGMELTATAARERAMSSFEYEDMQREGFVPEASLFVPKRFMPEISAEYKPASADYATEKVMKGSKRARELIQQGYKQVGDDDRSMYGQMVTLQKGTAEVLPEEAGYSWFHAANLGFTSIRSEAKMAKGDKAIGIFGNSYNQMLLENLMNYDKWNTSGGTLAKEERKATTELFKAQYGGMTAEQIKSGQWKQDLASNQRFAGMLFASENITRGQMR